MKPIPTGTRFAFDYTVQPGVTVPALYADTFPEFAQMPGVLATGLMVTLIEGCCQRAILPFLDWPREGSLGVHVDFSHLAPTPPGMTVHVTAEVVAVNGRRVVFRAEAFDAVECISRGTHERMVVDYERFARKAADKARAAGLAA
ncbi:MAG: hypothetical protein B7X31_13490 [Thiomonas sp. 13-66-29]|jgi:fluoroacetyl-CoA thioesterase|uniref:Fluoroacetyl-CoA thioesterase n=1 Tax=Thiomonas delicata TaxID=364030 RepID=A0A238D088_THIDL|nr:MULTISPECIES: thioesterase family protein [Thiomonas]OZB43630.1 MAG: hypothetical protein B7X46_12225 [Thiomonas sp. 15-66-11]OZB58582.1 MAG: hypothetical protein B7X31_13490 [Thiomonas sp. 13-66-29]SBP86662.1 Fluoroacetyl-CoA thioesterase [Thiomonas delicata]